MKEWASERRNEGREERGAEAGRLLRGALDAMRLFAALIGVVAICFGLIYAVSTFELVRKGVLAPEQYEKTVGEWEKILDIDGAVVQSGAETSIDVSRPVAVIIFVGLLVLLGILALGIMGAGARVISLTTGDAAAVKKVLRHAFGRTRNVQEPEEEGGE